MIDLTNKRIIVTYLMHLGDVILITPFLHVLRKNAQGSKITLVVDKKVADTVRYNPNIDELVEVDKKGPTIPSVPYGESAESCTAKTMIYSLTCIPTNGRLF